MLLNYAGPASNVRVERASCDCFKDGGALAELMSLFENKSADEGLQDNEGETTGEGYEPAIKVFFCWIVQNNQIVYFSHLSWYELL